jgi:SAM-dependent methyltransferase
MPGCYIGRQAVHLPIVDIKPCFENLPQASIRFQPVQNDGRIVVGVLDVDGSVILLDEIDKADPDLFFPIHSCVLGKARKIFWIDTVPTDENYSELCNGLSAIGYSRSAVKQNKYSEPEFFAEYSRMLRSIHGLAAAMEWAAFRALLPDLHDKRVLDLGCGFGWHCRYVHERGATKVVGIDISEKMLERARTTTNAPAIKYHRCAIEDVDFPANEFDIVINSLALHYVESFDRVCDKIHHCLTPNGLFLFSVEHPIFTTLPAQDWYYSPTGERLHWPIDNYQREGRRQTSWLTENVIKYHRTMATYVNMLIQSAS